MIKGREAKWPSLLYIVETKTDCFSTVKTIELLPAVQLPNMMVVLDATSFLCPYFLRCKAKSIKRNSANATWIQMNVGHAFVSFFNMWTGSFLQFTCFVSSITRIFIYLWGVLYDGSSIKSRKLSQKVAKIVFVCLRQQVLKRLVSF